jgi:hypothetical protein
VNKHMQSKLKMRFFMKLDVSRLLDVSKLLYGCVHKSDIAAVLMIKCHGQFV